MSSRSSEVPLSKVSQDREHLACNVAFEATDRLWLGHSLAHGPLHILPGALVVTEPDDNHAGDGDVGPVIAAPIEPVAVGFAQ